jgi:hypothetical protein
LLEFEEEFELEEEELLEEEPEEPDPEDEPEPDEVPECAYEPDPESAEDDPELWSALCCEDPEPPALRIAPASGSPRWPFPAPSCFGGF